MSTAADAARVLLALAEEGCAFAAAGRLEDLAGQQGAWEAAVTAVRAHGDRRA